jgi:phytol kinase
MQFIPLILTVVAVFIVLVANELLWRRIEKPNEFSRKFVHITVGSFVAFWPLFLSWTEIILLSGAFLVVVGASKYLKVFKAIHSVQRPTYGELFFALAVGVIAFVTNTPAIYTVALLHMSLADGLAAVFGIRYGKGNQYRVFGSTKSVAGTLTFFVISLALLLIFAQHIGSGAPFIYFAALALLTSLIENMGIYGLDNLLVPLVVASMLSIA